ncbi:MAG: DEAD/DEAH box helicase [Thermoanaerobaculales bacterium]|jgi:ATP-dependent RNA helicase RhlE|nr:DEAD/DEAH box helicase [Thermoanaerobaculales bacterium]
MNFHPAIQRGIRDFGFTEPTPIQRSSIPPALEGRDVLACAMTGSGKTAAFVLPMLQSMADTRSRSTRVLILTPTRELASQIHEHIEILARHTPLRSATVFGGVKPARQERALKSGVDIVVATPGRLLDLMQYPWANFDDLEFLVLDEGDRMLDMGFLPDVRRILARLPKQRQTMLFSATLPKPIVQLSRDFLDNPVRIDVERQSKPATGITQAILPVPEHLKTDLLKTMIGRGDVETALVFTRTKHRANRLWQKLTRAGVECERIHGNRSQPQREKALAAFKHGRVRILVATDIAARGIDVEALPHVINFDVPVVAEDYIHRVGRTARAGKIGDALTFASPEERGKVAAIERAVGHRLDRRQVEGFDYKARAQGRFEVPVGERIAAHRARRTDVRSKSNRQRGQGTPPPGRRSSNRRSRPAR